MEVNKMKKTIALIGVLFLIGCMFVPLVSASVIATSAENGDSMTASVILDLMDGSEAAACAQGSSFNATVTEYVHNITVRMKIAAGSPDVSLVASLVTINGDWASSAFPNTVLNSSLSFQANTTTLSGSYSVVTFLFADATQLAAGTQYGFYIYAASGTIDTSNRIQIDGDTADSYGGCRMTKIAAWLNYAGDMYFIINGGAAVPTTTPTPPPASPPSGSGDADMEALVAAILPWLVPLLICLIPALLGYKYVGELGFFIGLNVGCILAYVTLAGTAYAFPLWGIILVGVMDVAVVLMRR